MKKQFIKKGLCFFLIMTLFAGLLPMNAFAGWEDGIECEFCGGYRFDDWVCDDGPHCSDSSGASDCYYETVIRLDVSGEPRAKCSSEKMFFKVVKAAFSQRRKTVLNSISSGMGVAKADVEKALIDIVHRIVIRSGNRMPEELWSEIHNAVQKVVTKTIPKKNK